MISRWGEIDPSDGGKTGRYSLDAAWHLDRGNSRIKAIAYGLYYDLDLFSDFTYFLVDPVHGDQIDQQDNRFVFGGKTQPIKMVEHMLLGLELVTTFGSGCAQRRHQKRPVPHRTAGAAEPSTTQNDIALETTRQPLCRKSDPLERPGSAPFWGCRSDAYWMDVHNIAGGNSGDVAAQVP